MKKALGILSVLLLIFFILFGYSAIGEKAASLAIIYDTTAVVAFLLLLGYCLLIRKKDVWFFLLFSSVFVVNIGYLFLALSRSPEEALLANRVAYLGSVCLPLSMLMIILNVGKLRYNRWLPGILMVVGACVFLIAASPGYSDVYYKEVSLKTVNGISVLEKVYGPLHCLYLFYLLLYFAATTIAVIYISARKKLASTIHAAVLAAAVFINMGVWLLEQLVRIDFELLSVSYIISELFLLGLHLLVQEGSVTFHHIQATPLPSAAEEAAVAETAKESRTANQRYAYFASQLPRLTPTERIIYNLYLAGTSTKEVMASLNIKENTLKYHNKNIYSKLGVSSRKELVEIAEALKEE